jgi:DNA repair exonuclease SbcCD ATPase subunit/DNA repair exonuclease SbcCD nuclease subunit
VRIAHVSDLHIRNFKYRREYAEAFVDLYGKLDKLRPDLIINTGDTVHSKLAVSPELFDDVANHLLCMSSIAPHWLVLGNHDLNLKNPGRTDAISPIVRALQGRTKHELRMPGPYRPERMLGGSFQEFAFYSYDIRKPVQKVIPQSIDVNIGLYHGSISGCVTDQGFVMEEGEAEVDQFKWMDYVMMGDIHKRQSFRDGRLQYPGSLIQQNYGEELVKGFLLWDIQDRKNFSVSFHEVRAPGRFYTIQVPSTLSLDDVDVPKGSRIRAMVQGELSPSKRMELESALVAKFEPLEVITPDSSGEKAAAEAPDIDDLVGSREQMMRDHLKERGITDADEVDEVLKLFAEFEKGLDLDDSARGTTWQLHRISWDNMMNFGEGNVIDLTKLKGLVGVFAPNASGKSSIFDIMLQSLFDKVAKDVPRNIDLVNDNKDSGKMTVEFESNGTPYCIERTIERIHYGQRKLAETKQWGKTSLEFSSVDDSLNGTSRPETERSIRAIVGNFDDFALTTMVSQNPIFGLPGGGDIINCRETDRRKILFRFLDLDVYERVNQACKEELKTILGSLKGQDREALARSLEEIESELLYKQSLLTSERVGLETDGCVLVQKRQELAQLEADDRAQDAQDITKLDDAAVMAAKRFRKAHEAHEKSEKACKEADEAYIKLIENKPERPTITLEELTAKMEKVRTERESAKVNLSKQKDTLSRGKKALVTLDGVPCEGKFPTCKFIKDASEFLTQRDIVEAALKFYEAVVDVSNGEISSLEGFEVMHVAVARWERQVVEAKAKYERLFMETKALLTERDAALDASLAAEKAHREALEKLDPTIGQQIKDMKDYIQTTENIANDRKRKIELYLRHIGAAEAKKAAAERLIAELDDMKKKVRTYEQLAELTGKNGLPYRILMLVLPIINDEISKILTGIVRFNVFFEDDPEEQTVSLFIRYGDYKSRPLSLGSGAEKFIASLAIRVALLSVSSLPKTDILVIDEGFGKLDPEHLEALQKMFEYLREAFGTVFIVSHVDSMRDIVDHSLDITSIDGYAHVEAV